MGEPLLNLPNVLEAIRDPASIRRASRSAPRADHGLDGGRACRRSRPLLAAAPVHLAVSLHATTDAVRDVLVPLNKRFPLDELLATLRSELAARRRAAGLLRVHADGRRQRLARGRARACRDCSRGLRCEGQRDPDEPPRRRALSAAAEAVVDRFAGGPPRGRPPRHRCGAIAAATSTPPAASSRTGPRRPVPEARSPAGSSEAGPESRQERLAEDRCQPGEAGSQPGGRGSCSTRSATSTGASRSSTSCSRCFRSRPGDKLVFLGDYIDRGPDSPGVIERLIELRCALSSACSCSATTSRCSSTSSAGPTTPTSGATRSCMNGGDRTLAGYGYFDRADTDRETFTLPKSHEDFLLSLRLSTSRATTSSSTPASARTICAAATSPYALRKSRPEDLLWNRDERRSAPRSRRHDGLRPYAERGFRRALEYALQHRRRHRRGLRRPADGDPAPRREGLPGLKRGPPPTRRRRPPDHVPGARLGAALLAASAP